MIFMLKAINIRVYIPSFSNIYFPNVSELQFDRNAIPRFVVT